MPTKRAKKAPRKGKPTTPRVINASEQGDIMIVGVHVILAIVLY